MGHPGIGLSSSRDRMPFFAEDLAPGGTGAHHHVLGPDGKDEGRGTGTDSASPAARTSAVMDATSTTICSAKVIASDLGTAERSRLARATARACSVSSVGVFEATASINSSHAAKAGGA